MLFFYHFVCIIIISRREELGVLRNTNNEDEDKDDDDATNQCSIDDETVVDSFLEELQLGGSLYDYLSLADVAIVIGTTLFCHGAVDRQTMGFVPKVRRILLYVMFHA